MTVKGVLVLVVLTKKDEDTYYIDCPGGTDKEYSKFVAALGTVEKKVFDSKAGKWLCGRVDAVRIQDQLNYPEIGNDMKLKPYGYQRQAIAFCAGLGCGLVRLPCGSGKTPIGLSLFLNLRKKEHGKLTGIFVVKVSLKNQWLDEVQKFTDLRAGEIATYKSVTAKYTTRIKAQRLKADKIMEEGPNAYVAENNFSGFAKKLADIKHKIDDIEAKAAAAFDDMFDTKKYDIFVVNYEALLDDKVSEKLHEMHPDFWYVDEIDYIKSPDAKRSMAVSSFNDAKYRFGATATPIRKNPLDLYGIFRFLKPDLFPSKSKFENSYLKFYYGRISGSKNEDVLAKKVEPYIFKRSMDEIADQLPSQLVYPIYCHFTEKQQRMWKKIYGELEDLQEQLKDMYTRFTPAQLAQNAQYQKLKDAVSARQTFAQMQADSEELLMASSRAAQCYVTGDPSSKVAACIAILDKILASGEKCVIFSKYLGMQDILKREIAKDKELKDVVVDAITGATPNNERSEILKAFNSKKKHQVLLLSDAGEAGINVKAAKYMIEMDLADSAAKQTQRHGRIRRADSEHRKVFVYQLIVKDSYDDTIALKSIQKKAGYAERIL